MSFLRFKLLMKGSTAMYGEDESVTGDEILNGQILDINSQWLSLRLESVGVRMLYHTAVRDELDAIKGVFQIALERADVIVCTGGLGTEPDRSRRGKAWQQPRGNPCVKTRRLWPSPKPFFARRNRPSHRRPPQAGSFSWRAVKRYPIPAAPLQESPWK